MNGVSVIVRLAGMEKAAWRSDLAGIDSKLPGAEEGLPEPGQPTIETRGKNALFHHRFEFCERRPRIQRPSSRRKPESRSHAS